MKMNHAVATLLSKVERLTESGCWIWMGALDKDGYGQTRWNGKFARPHRVLYAELRGPIGDGLTIDHLCRVRCCVNPDHLEPVPMRTNVLRGTSFAARNANKASCPKCGGPWESFVHRSKSGRRCRPCTLAYMRKYDAAKALRLKSERAAKQETVTA